MLVIVYGGSGSGKSAFAETRLVQLCSGLRKYYIATMHVYGEEGRRKVERHRKLREGKGFITIEAETDVRFALAAPEPCGILLESLSNLTANEMFRGGKQLEETFVTDKVMRDLKELDGKAEHMVIVADNVFEDETRYDNATLEYIKAMGNITRLLADAACEVWEVVCGIPVMIR